MDAGLLDRILDLAELAPSVGNSQPWRVISVESQARRSAVIAHFNDQNATAANAYDGERGALYRRLKLAGLEQAPVHLAVFCDDLTRQGERLGAATMPETRAYSVACYIHTLWLAARAEGLGLGWISILDPLEIAELLEAPSGWRLIGYLCLGWPEEDHLVPELERQGWQARRNVRPAPLLR